MKNMIAAAVLTALCAASAAAVDFDSNKDALAQAQADLAQEQGLPEGGNPLKMTLKGMEIPSQSGPVSIDAVATGDAALIRSRHMNETKTVRLFLNNVKDRVGAVVSVCHETSPEDGPQCDTVSFLFSESDLTVDRENKRIMRGSDVVATYGGFWGGIKMSKEYRLSYRVARQERRNRNADVITVEVYSVTLEKIGS